MYKTIYTYYDYYVMYIVQCTMYMYMCFPSHFIIQQSRNVLQAALRLTCLQGEWSEVASFWKIISFFDYRTFQNRIPKIGSVESTFSVKIYWHKSLSSGWVPSFINFLINWSISQIPPELRKQILPRMGAVLQEPTGCQLAIYKLCAQPELSIWNHLSKYWDLWSYCVCAFGITSPFTSFLSSCLRFF